MSKPKEITAQWFNDPNPYNDTGRAMVVTNSTHPRFIKGSRFDFGFLQIASEKGYKITIHPMDKGT